MDLLYSLSKLPTSGLTVIDDRAYSGYYRIEGNLSWDIGATRDDVRGYFRGSGATLGDCTVETRDNLLWFQLELK